MRVEIIFDTVCPWCYVGKRRIERAFTSRPAIRPEFIWRPFLLNPDLPNEGIDRRSHLERKFGSEHRVQRVFGRRLGLELDPMDKGQHIAFIQCTFARADTWSLWQKRLGSDRPLHSFFQIVQLGWGAYWRLLRSTPLAPFCVLSEKLVFWLLSFVPRRVSPDFRSGISTAQTVKA